MIDDARLKVRLRLRAVIERMKVMATLDSREVALIRQAFTDPLVAGTLKVKYRRMVESEFPGCEVQYSPFRLGLKLPALYPSAQVPITEPIPASLTPVLFGVPRMLDF